MVVVTRQKEIQKYRDLGNSFSEIARIMGVSRQRIHQIYFDYKSPSSKKSHHIPKIKRKKILKTPKILRDSSVKRCYGECKVDLPLEMFYGSSHICKNCTKLRQRKYFHKRYKEYKKGGKYYLQSRARSKVNRSLLKGILKKGDCCVKDDDCHGRIEAHHYLGYEEKHWLDIKWYCQRHHLLMDKTPWMKNS